MTKLNLASGTHLFPPPWVNLDIVPKWPSAEHGCDLVWDARKHVIPFPDNSVDEVYAGYLFLHLSHVHHMPVLKEIRRVMAPGSWFMVCEVDMEVLLPRWLANPADLYLSGLVWGEQGADHGEALAEFDKHCHGYTERTLHDFLAAGGFTNLARIQVHADEVWYDLSFRACKET